MNRIVDIRASDDVAGDDPAAVIQSLCDTLAAHLASVGAAGAVLDDVIWLEERGKPARITIVARPGPQGSTLGVAGCRAFLAEKKRREREEAA